MSWITKKFHYKIVNQNGETIAYVHKLLSELEEFALESGIQINSLKRSGVNSFNVHVTTMPGWEI